MATYTRISTYTSKLLSSTNLVSSCDPERMLENLRDIVFAAYSLNIKLGIL